MTEQELVGGERRGMAKQKTLLGKWGRRAEQKKPGQHRQGSFQ